MADVYAEKPVRNKSILIVDDQDTVRSATVFIVKMLGHDVCEAEGAETAIQFFKTSPLPEIVISDVQMPGIMDGLGLRKWIRAHHPNVRVILTSGCMEAHSEAGDDFLQKPYTLRAIKEIIDRDIP